MNGHDVRRIVAAYKQKPGIPKRPVNFINMLFYFEQ